QSDLPPIGNIPDIFKDLTSRVTERLNGRKLRVATMCSGTESPLLALEMFGEMIERQYDQKLRVDHIFSCEIEPFKQAYIERNFKPPILFRDVCELGGETATTAYGAEVPVVGDVDLLVSGTSCVDFSNLNNKKQELDAKGESGRTFRGMMSWITNHRPPIVIIENVLNAPWKDLVQKFEEQDYAANFCRLDTKNYYIPHTRCRGYLVAFDRKKGGKTPMTEEWAKMMKSLERSASVTLESFMLDTDDPRVYEAREKLSADVEDRKAGRLDWGRCESRHQRARLVEGLGNKRPFTTWDESGHVKVPDFAWADWASVQVERVWDLMDIETLRAATRGVDPSFKTQLWNLSQNVDRSIGSSMAGISPCLTPTMIPYLTNRGGPLVGLEALSLQGLPVDKLLLTREKEDQLFDLAGNAMSTTVVGCAIVSALIIGKKMLTPGDENAMEVEEPKENSPNFSEMGGLDQLTEKPLDLQSTTAVPLKKILTEAQRSSRLCECEGRAAMTSRSIQRCSDCFTSTCVKCGGRPEHNYQILNFQENPRLSPVDFAITLKSALPMRISLRGMSEELLCDLWKSQEAESKMWKPFSTAFLRGVRSELYFSGLKRQDFWIATYKSPQAIMELILHPLRPEWRFYGIPEASEPANSPVRKLLSQPAARSLCKETLFDGKWQIAFPIQSNVRMHVRGVGEMVPAWEARLGLQEPFKEWKVFSSLSVDVDEKDRGKFDRDVRGTYQLLERCGTANSALHKLMDSDDSLPPLYLFLDPSRTGDPADDSFVFSESIHRCAYGEARCLIGKLQPDWRPKDKMKTETIKCTVDQRWIDLDRVSLEASACQKAIYASPTKTLEINSTQDSCLAPSALLLCKVPLGENPDTVWPRDSWKEIDKVRDFHEISLTSKIHERETFKSLSWLTERVKNLGHVSQWTTMTYHNQEHCQRCAPVAPSIQWIRGKKGYVPHEDTVQAGVYEQALKRRPSPFTVQLHYDTQSTMGTMQIGINVASLAHRALSRFSKKSIGTSDTPKLSWRLDTEFHAPPRLEVPPFFLTSNKKDDTHKQLSYFKLPLRHEQLRSLTWMREQEENPKTFVEEEIAEAILDSLSWRAEGKAERNVLMKGGVLADEVGYGKTAISIGLIASTREERDIDMKKGDVIVDGTIRTKATCVVVPAHLVRQWPSEFSKFVGKELSVVAIKDQSDLNNLSVKDILQADVIVVAVTIFKSPMYQENMAAFAGVEPLPGKPGRHFDLKYRAAVESTKRNVETLVKEGGKALLKKIKDVYHQAPDTIVAPPSKRLKGKQYREAAERDEEDIDQLDGMTRSEPEGGYLDVSVPIRLCDRKDVETQRILLEQWKEKNRRKGEEKVTEEKNGGKKAPGSPMKKQSTILSMFKGVNSKEKAKEQKEEEKKEEKTEKKEEEKKEEKEEEKKEEKKEEKESAAKVTGKGLLTKKTTKKEEKPKEDTKSSGSEKMRPSRGSTSRKPTSYIDDTSSEEEVRKVKAKGRGKSSKKAQDESEDDFESGSEEDSNIEDSAAESEVETKAKPKKKEEKSKPKAEIKSQKEVKVTTNKRKREEFEDPEAKKRQSSTEGRVQSDPWKLGSRSRDKGDWEKMQAPSLSMFKWHRLIIDEFTYLEGQAHTAVTLLDAQRRWILSGTPPIQDFASVQTIAVFLGIHLGIDDDSIGKSTIVKSRRKDQTAAEKFHSFREVRSISWHAHRHEIAQKFLSQFARQNVADIDEIPWKTHREEIVLPAAERAIYLELEHHLLATDNLVKKVKKSNSDRETRLAETLGDSDSAEEALLKRCSHFDLDVADAENAMKECEVIVQHRKKQLEACRKDVQRQLEKLLDMQKGLKGESDTMFLEWQRVIKQEGVGDRDATTEVVRLMEKVGINMTKIKPVPEKRVEISKEKNEKIYDVRQETHVLRSLVKELTARVRSLRFFTAVRDMQGQGKTKPVVDCPKCGTKSVELEEISLLSSCGHMSCHKCVTECAAQEICPHSLSGGCSCGARAYNIVKATTLGEDDVERDGKGRHFGRKLETVMDLIRNKIPKNERVLLFVQFSDLMKKVGQALDHNKIPFLCIDGTPASRSKKLMEFQDEKSKEKVLMLNVMDESASGANLTCANHVIFLSPLLASSEQIYRQAETQAIGRARRYGQKKTVHIWR
ncbi:DNA repair protein rad8, partial [Planoprotostelium fungivorum]